MVFLRVFMGTSHPIVAGSTYRHVMTHMTGGDGFPEQLAHLGEMAAEASVSSALES